jgi:exosortase
VSQLAHTETSSAHQETMVSRLLPYWQLGVLGILTAVLYGPVLRHLVGQWWEDPNFSHGFFVPLFSVFVVWQERARLSRLASKPSWFGLAIVAFGMGTLIVGQMGAELFLTRTSLLIALAGLIVLFYGWIFLRALLFPWAFLFLMVPMPAIIFNQITFPLQLLASRVSAAILPFFGVPILREGNVIILPSMALEVAEACSGIRSLMSLVTLSIIYGYLLEKRLWVRYLLAAASIPIAVAANSVRIIGTGLLVQYWDPEKAEGYFHASWGWIIFVISLILLYGLHALIGWIWPERSPKS